MTEANRNTVVIAVLGSVFATIGAWIGQPVWAALIGGALGGGLMAAEPLIMQHATKKP